MTWICNYCKSQQPALRNVCQECGEPQRGFDFNMDRRLQYLEDQLKKARGGPRPTTWAPQLLVVEGQVSQEQWAEIQKMFANGWSPEQIKDFLFPHKPPPKPKKRLRDYLTLDFPRIFLK